MKSNSGQTVLKYRIHWHVLFTHFPISFFGFSCGLILLYLAEGKPCYEFVAYLSLAGGVVMLTASILSGWLTWKKRYKGLRGKIFIRKIRIAFTMLAVSVAVLIWRTVFPATLRGSWFWLYLVGGVLLLAGATAEGYYGGRLNHR